MMKVTRSFAVLMGVLLIFNMLLLAGCSETATDTKSGEEQAEAVIRACYDAQLAGDYEAATELLIFSERANNMNMKDLFPGSFATSPTQSYTIHEIEKLTDELYAVNVIGVFLTPFDLVYGEDGKPIGTKDDEREGWYINHFDITNYAAFVDGKWGVCNTAWFVPEGMYDFPENELKEPTGLPSLEEEDGLAENN